MDNENIIKMLNDYGENINSKNGIGMTLLLFACYFGNENLVLYLFEHGADINYKIESIGLTSLIIASRKNDEAIIKNLVNNNDDINICDKDNKTIYIIKDSMELKN